ncbi:hypothetical protein AB833_06495 [Chromatiales bacterium (ex Bugula neritina AB1)]|nr:hypothetical protein AB833_06495 [Chromatiales bacterium (ex Bugula neritina AB1)]
MNYCKCMLPVSVLALVSITGCSDSTNFDFDNSLTIARDNAAANTAVVANFDPATGSLADLPFPNSLLFSGSEDGTLNIPVADPNDLADAVVSLNALDGFSTTAPLSMPISGSLNMETVIVGESLRVFEVQTDANGAVTQVIAEIGADRLAAAETAGALAIVPLLPFKESTDYVVIATNAITGANGVPLSPSTAFRLTSGTTALSGEAAALEPVRQLTNAMLAAVQPQAVERSSIVQAWSFKTQSISPVLQAIKSTTVAQPITIVPTGQTTNTIDSRLPGIADVYIGTLDLPYYRTAPANANDATGITSFWQGQGGSLLTRFNTSPVATSVQTVPVLMTVPNAGSGNTVPANGWPVSIFVHGITQDRTNLFGIADAMAQAGIAVIAIDQPMHGIVDSSNVLAAANTPFADTERTFDIDLINNETGAPGPDLLPDPSGRHFFSPQFLLATRDNLRQSIADLMVLSASLGNITTVPVNAAQKTLIGHSLGGAAATPFLAFDDSIVATTLGMPAAGLVGVTLASEAFGPAIIAGLAAAGVDEGTPEFEQFKVAAQTVVDSGDAINFGAMAAQNSPVHLIEVLGDTTVNNVVEGAPLAGTEALIRVMGLPSVSQDTTESGVVRFTAGGHGSLISPDPSVAAFTEMQTQTATFAASSGTLIDITDTSVVQ